MPNHCHNRVYFYNEDKPEQIKELHDIFSRGVDENEERSVFGAFIPEPDWKNTPLAETDHQQYSFSNKRGEIGELPVQSDEKFKGLEFKSTGIQDDRWYDWRNQNWGTKWDAYDLTMDESEMPHGLEVEFNSAWCPPEEVCHAIRE